MTDAVARLFWEMRRKGCGFWRFTRWCARGTDGDGKKEMPYFGEIRLLA